MAYENDRSNPSASFLDEDSLILARLLKRNCRIIGPIFLALALVLFLVISVFGPANRYLRLFVLVPPIWLIMGIGFFVMSYLQPTHLLRIQRLVTGRKLFEHQKKRARQITAKKERKQDKP